MKYRFKERMGLVLTVIKNLKIRFKLLIFIYGVMFFFVWIIGFFSFQKAEEIILQETTGSIMQTFRQANQNIEYKVNTCERLINNFYTNREFQRLLDAEYENQYDWYIAKKKIEEIKYSLLLNGTDNVQIRVYTQNETIPNDSLKDDVISLKDKLVGQNWYNALIKSKGIGQVWGNVFITNEGQRIYMDDKSDNIFKSLKGDYYSFVAKLMVNELNGRPLGVIMLEISKSKLFESLNEINIGKTGEVFLIDDSGSIIFSGRKNRIGNNVAFEEYNRKVKKLQNGAFSYSINKKLNMVIFDSNAKTGWTIFGYYPVNEIAGKTTLMRDYIILLSGICIIVLIIVVFIYVRGVTSRIITLTDEMKKAGTGDLDVTTAITGDDEIGVMSKVFESMLRQIRELILQKSKAKNVQHKLELQALQEQINPHFLYNTLSAINSAALDIDAYEISNMVCLLSKFYNLTLSKGMDVITIGNEICHMKSYVELLKFRLKERIVVNYEVDSSLLDYYTPKLILQPFIENAIFHGFDLKKLMPGNILFKASVFEEVVVFEIIDDGKGMSEEEVLKIMNSDSQGYAIKNVDTRVKLYFGDKYGVFINSSVGLGTTVKIEMPVISNIDYFRNSI